MDHDDLIRRQKRSERIAIGAMAAAIVSALVGIGSLFEARKSRLADLEALSLQTRPTLRVDVKMDPLKPEIVIRNEGFGPAVIRSVMLRTDIAELATNDPLFEASPESVKGNAIAKIFDVDATELSGENPYRYNWIPSGTPIGANAEVPIITTLSRSSKENEPLLRGLRRSAESFNVKITYCDLAEQNCYEFQWRDGAGR